MTGLGRLLVLQLRTGWKGLLVWPLAVAGLIAATAAGVSGLFATAAERAGYAATVGDSLATQALNGRPYGLDSIGGIAAYEVGFSGQLLFPIAALAVALRHTRREEESGRHELVTAGRVGPWAPLGAAVLLVLAVAVAAGALSVAGLLLVSDLPVDGVLWYSAGIAGVVGFFGAAGLLIAQLVQTTRTGWVVGLAAIATAFLARVLVDGLGWSTTWLSPLGWYPEIRPYTEDPRVIPLVAYAVWFVVLVAGAFAIRSVRDLGFGLLAPRPGPAQGRVRTPGALAWRLTRGPIIGWCILAVVIPGVFGSLAEEMAELVDSNPSILEALGIERGSDLIMQMGVLIAAIAGCAAAVQGVNRLGEEESSDRLGMLMASRVSRTSLWSVWLVIVAVASAAVVMAGGLALGVTTMAVTGESDALGRALGAAAGYVLPVVVLAAVTAMLRALRPGAGMLGWVAVGWVGIVGFLAETLRLPEWARDLSPVHLVGELPMTDLSVSATVTLGLLTAVSALVSWRLFTRRDLHPQ